MKRGQSHLLFVYILAAVIFALVFILGYKFVSSLGEKETQIVRILSASKLKSDIDSIKSQYGSERKIYYEIPEDIQEVCFYQKQENPAQCTDLIPSPDRKSILLMRGTE